MAAGRRKGDEGVSLVKLTKEDRTMIKKLLIGAASSLLVISLLSFLVVVNYINLSGHVNDSQLWDASYYHRLEFAMRYQAIGATWLFFSVIYVIYKRISDKAYDPISSREHESVTIAKNNLTNSVEQFLLIFLSQIISLSYLDETCVLKIIPLINLSFLIGRIGFLVGYPKYRDFGMFMTLFPTAALTIYNLYSFTKYVFL